MLQINKRSLAEPTENARMDSVSPSDTLKSYLAVIKRQFPLIALIVGCSTGLGVIYLATTPSSFTAKATMEIDTRKVQLFQQQSVLGDIAIDPGTVETQIEILKSDDIGLSVIKDLKLAEDPEFVGPGGGLIGAVVSTISGLFDSGGEGSEYEMSRHALSAFEKARDIKRVGLTYIMEITFRSLDAEKAARIANAIADAYVVDQLEAKYQTTRRASSWLQDRIKELRAEASLAERAVFEFKEKNNIVDTGGRLMNEQQLAELNSQLILARAASAEAKARLDRIDAITEQDIPDASVTDALKNDVIVRLRGQYVDLSAREADWTARYGANHLASVDLRNQMKEIRHSIKNEIERIGQSYRSDYEIALTREESIRRSLGEIVSESQLTSQAQLGVRELESNAQTARTMYDNFLQRYMEAVQQQSFPITEARLITHASRPLKSSYPKSSVVLGVSFAGGLLLSFGVALMRELSDNSFRTGAQVENVMRVNCLAVLPALGKRALRNANRAAQSLPIPDGPRMIVRNPSLLWAVVDTPLSRFTEAIRGIKVAIDLGPSSKTNKVIGVTSSVPNEGKSTIASNVAQLIAHAGAKVVLVDADLRNPSLSRLVSPGDQDGLVDVIAGRRQIEDVIWTDPSTQLAFVPAGATSKLLHTNEILGSDAMERICASLRDRFDYVIIDLPPLAPIVDVRMTTRFIDSYAFVVEWGRTKIDVIEHNLAGAQEIYGMLLGVILNKADIQVLSRYEGYQSGYYGKKYYGRYGYVE